MAHIIDAFITLGISIPAHIGKNKAAPTDAYVNYVPWCDVRAAYKAMARKVHPDRPGGASLQEGSLFCDVSAAHDILRDAYESRGASMATSPPPPSAPSAPARPATYAHTYKPPAEDKASAEQCAAEKLEREVRERVTRLAMAKKAARTRVKPLQKATGTKPRTEKQKRSDQWPTIRAAYNAQWAYADANRKRKRDVYMAELRERHMGGEDVTCTVLNQPGIL
jgi:hypothetical protein